MNEKLMYLILTFFLLGGVGIYLSGRRQDLPARKKNWLKYFTYILIIAFLYNCILFAEKFFPWVCLLIVLVGALEIINLQRKRSTKENFILYAILSIYLLISFLFLKFSSLSQTILLFTLFTVCSFDAFCQITGQLFGKRRIVPKISPNKTREGLLGGTAISVGVFLVIGNMLDLPLFYTVLMGSGICLFAFGGDLLASRIKRQYDIKDFSSILPGHGGFLDRFDSFIVAGAFVYLFNFFFQMP